MACRYSGEIQLQNARATCHSPRARAKTSIGSRQPVTGGSRERHDGGDFHGAEASNSSLSTAFTPSTRPYPSRRPQGQLQRPPPRTAAACPASATPSLPITASIVSAPAVAPRPLRSPARTACLPCVRDCRLEIASPRPRPVCSRTGIEPDNDDTDTTATMSIDGLFYLSVVIDRIGDIHILDPEWLPRSAQDGCLHRHVPCVAPCRAGAGTGRGLVSIPPIRGCALVRPVSVSGVLPVFVTLGKSSTTERSASAGQCGDRPAGA